jgi:hypothetical protein
MHQDPSVSGTALDLLEREDITLRAVFTQVKANQGPTVEERAEYGDLAKRLIHHVATREAALVDVTNVVSEVPELDAVSEYLERGARRRRKAIGRVEKMSRGVQGMNLNTGQEFDKELTELIQIVGSEIEWDLEEGIPAVRSVLESQDKVDELKSADHVTKHAPTNLHPEGGRWFEKAPVISRLVTIYDRLRDFPKATREH